MIQRWETKRSRERTLQLMEEQLFCDMYDTLKSITEEYGEPSPAQLWDEAALRWKPLIASKRPQVAVEILKEELTETYGERSAFLVLMILMYMMVAVFRPSDKENPYRVYCAALAEATEGHPLLQRLYDGVRQTEDEEEKAGRRIGVVTSLLTEMNVAGESINYDDIERIILRNPTFELQQKALDQFDILLRGTAWSQRSVAVQEKMFAMMQQKQDRQHDVEERFIEAANCPKAVYQSGSTHNDYSRHLNMGDNTIPVLTKQELT